MEELQSWWEICKIGGAGASVVLGPVLLYVMHQWRADQLYIREQDKNTLNVLNELTKVIADASTTNTTGFADLKGAIQQGVDHIKGHIDASFRK